MRHFVKFLLVCAFLGLVLLPLALLADGPGGGGGGGGACAPSRVAVAADAVLPAGTTYADITSLAADRQITLPAATATCPLVIADSTGSAGHAAFLAKIVPAGSDTIDGLSAIILDEDYAAITLMPDGTSKWKIMPTSGAQAWGIDPRTISGLVDWYEADRTDTMTIVTGSGINQVSSWGSLAASGHAATNGTAAQRPQLIRGVGGHAVVTYDGSDDNLVTGSYTTNSGSATMVVAGGFSGSGNAANFPLWYAHANGTNAGFSMGTCAAAFNFCATGLVFLDANGGILNADAHTTYTPNSTTFGAGANGEGTIPMRVMIARIGTTGAKFAVNGLERASTSVTAAVAAYTGTAVIGGSGAMQSVEQIGALLVFDAYMSDANVLLVNRWLANKRGIKSP